MNYDDDRPDALPMRPTSSCGGGCSSASGARMPLPRPYDDLPDSLGFYQSTPSRISLPPMFPRFDDLPDSPGFYQNTPSQPPIQPVTRFFDDRPDSPGFYQNPPVRTASPPAPRFYDDRPDSLWFHQTAPAATSPVSTVSGHRDDLPDSLGFYQNASAVTPILPVLRHEDDRPDSLGFHQPSAERRMPKPPHDYRDDLPDSLLFGQRYGAVTSQRPVHRPCDDLPDSWPYGVDYAARQPHQAAVSTQRSQHYRPFDDLPDSWPYGVDHITKQPHQTPTTRWLPQYTTMRQHNEVPEYGLFSSASTQKPVLRFHDDLSDVWYPSYRFVRLENPKHTTRQNISQRSAYGNWDYLENFHNDPEYFVGAILGKAVGISSNHCSPWNIGGPFLIRSAHCNEAFSTLDRSTLNKLVLEKDGCLKNFSILVKAGYPDRNHPVWVNYGDSRNFTNHSEIRAKLVDLGVPESEVRKIDEETINRLFWFSHQYEKTYFNSLYNCRDIEMFRAKSQPIEYQLDNKKQKIELLPSHLYGSIPFITEYKAKLYNQIGRPVYALSVNKKTPNEEVHSLLSPSGTLSYPYAVYPDENFSAINLYTLVGSSGGALMDLRTNQSLGVISHLGTRIFNFLQHPYTAASIIPDDVMNMVLSQKPTTDPLEQHESILYGTSNPYFNPILPWSWANRFGQILSRAFDIEALSCPNNYAAAGIIASTVTRKGERIGDDSMIGNLGLICLPYLQMNSRYQFDYATVIAGGSFDTSILPIDNMPFTHYYPRYSSSSVPEFSLGRTRAGELQSFAMCPPGYYLRGIHALPGYDNASKSNVIRMIYQLDCRKGDLSHDYTRRPRIGMGGSNFTSWSMPTACRIGFVSGIRIYKGDVSYGFQLDCKVPGKSFIGQTVTP